MKVVELLPAFDCEGVAKGLRNIADEVEAGKYDFDPSIAVVVLGRESQRRENGDIVDSFQWQTHGLGKGSYFAFKGLLVSATGHAEGEN